MIDFSKIGEGVTSDTVIPPREIFNALPAKNAEKFQYPRDVQSQVWAKWYDRRNENNLVIKMNTGSGKTVVGLLILKSCLNEGNSPAVYVCPDKYLVQQVLDAANELGVETTDNLDSPRFLSGKAILVINIFKLVNGMSKFGVGDEGAKLRISSLIIDDAHACLDTVEQQFTINIRSTTEAYNELYEVIQESLHKECETKAIEIESGDPTSHLQVPYWVWQSKNTEISQILVKHRESDDLKFVWPLVKENILLSHCVVSCSGIEITPHNIPIHMIPSIVDADRKIFMTATLVDDSILVSHFGALEENIRTPIIPDSAGDIGDRMILFPQVINTDTTDEDIKLYCESLSKKINVVVIVPSRYRANFWSSGADLVLDKHNLYKGIESLKNGHIGLTVLINRYDGIDLPGTACRLLVIDGFPDVRRKIDKIKQSILMGCSRQKNQVIQRIEQGMGRGIRSNDDFCVVLLMGRNLTSQIYSQGAIEKFSPGTKAQLELSEQVSEQIKGKPITEINDTINYCLSRDEHWVAASKGALASLKFSDANEVDKIVISLRAAYELASNNNYVKASEALDVISNTISDKKLKGYVKQLFAEYTNLHDGTEAQKIQMSASEYNRRILKPIEGIQYHKVSSAFSDQAISCSNYISSKHSDPNDLIIKINGILGDLEFKANSSNRFEEGFKTIAKYIGFQSQRPEQEYKKGPDVLWQVGELNFFVIECKNEAVVDTISKKYCNQLNGSCLWFVDKYGDTCAYTPIMTHPSTMFEYAASPHPQTKIITKEKLSLFCESVRKFINSIASNNELNNQVAIREKLQSYNLRSIDFIDLYTENFKVKNS